ncbi:hypothetical protein ABAC460_19650 [Asticcacaulis sp. AC460]|uniref:type II toxin-antitoxin system ParD family antitoxin n=1 Tax=Asticcacaulis sp. AC460 TaxID=1282360 RepID=UPI0003C3FB0B|nr:type II toxin-antitoxin system ParD family antitoxin [Asticcacaulis sp. AC460]ESQ87544.1 hypothetical protein ABAC460_19650 [Asticcacaulis sp. AC460]
MPTRNINLTPHYDDLVADYVTSGRYQNASEVIREGLRLMEARDAEMTARLEALRSAVDVGIADIEAGRFREFASGTELSAYLKARRAEPR